MDERDVIEGMVHRKEQSVRGQASTKHRSSLRRLSGLRQGCHEGLEVLTAFSYMKMVK